MSTSYKRLVIIMAVVFVIGGGGYALDRIFWKPGTIPQDFTDARLQGALISQNIVNLSNQSVLDLSKINELDNRGSYTDALNMTTDVIKQSQQIRDQAVELSSQIEVMTKSLSDIDSLEARQAALEAISNRLALISRLINYSGYLGQLLDTLRNHFTGSKYDNNDITNLVDQINSEVRAINNFNNQATQAMDRFDSIVKQ
ncbi:MAG: hypothetical protein KGJ89_03660 [Patescibacteria group bacterium]|nr:hypothetical protein [Patescibacteria group bacterium]MDE2015221.1 hypothetical protein [Patescibacteria group bacterium]MDE2227027.1 hypothetical protein [Patescibacteria group bacterium]